MFGANTDDDAVAGVDFHGPARETVGQDRVHRICRAVTVPVDGAPDERRVNVRAFGPAHGGALLHEPTHRLANIVAARDAGWLTRQRENGAAAIDAELLPKRGDEIFGRGRRDPCAGEELCERGAVLSLRREQGAVAALPNIAGVTPFGGNVHDHWHDTRRRDVGLETRDMFYAVLQHGDARIDAGQRGQPLCGGFGIIGLGRDEQPIDRLDFTGIERDFWRRLDNAVRRFDAQVREWRAGAEGDVETWILSKPRGDRAANRAGAN